jgi:hypothetical protein
VRHHEITQEASPNTWAGSFTPDLVSSKTWLTTQLKKQLAGESAGDIYVLGSWWGNTGVFVQQAGIKFDRLIMVERRRHLLASTKMLLSDLWEQGRLVLLHQDAANIEYPTNKKVTVINTSSNDMPRTWITRVPRGTLTVIQSRDNVKDVKVITDTAAQFYAKFPLENTVYWGQRRLRDPETRYTRFMKIGYK